MTASVTISPTIEFAPGERSDPGASLRPSPAFHLARLAPVPAPLPVSRHPSGKLATVLGVGQPTPLIPLGTGNHETVSQLAASAPGKRTGERSELLKPFPATPCLFRDRSSPARAVVVQVHRSEQQLEFCVEPPGGPTPSHSPASSAQEVRRVQLREDCARSDRGAPGD